MVFALTLCLQIGLDYSAVHAGAEPDRVVARHRDRRGHRRGRARPAASARWTLHAGIVPMLGRRAGDAVAWSTRRGAGLDELGSRAAGAARRRSGWARCSPRCSTSSCAGVDDDEVGSASGTLNAIQQLGGALGVAVLGTLFFSAASHDGFLVAFERTLWVEAGVLVATAALVFLLPMRAREPVPRSGPVRRRGQPLPGIH